MAKKRNAAETIIHWEEGDVEITIVTGQRLQQRRLERWGFDVEEELDDGSKRYIIPKDYLRIRRPEPEDEESTEVRKRIQATAAPPEPEAPKAKRTKKEAVQVSALDVEEDIEIVRRKPSSRK